MTAFGRPERGEFTPVLDLIAEALPAFAVEDDDGAPLDGLVEDAGFTLELAEYRSNTEHYADLDALIRGYLAIGPLRQAVRSLGEARVADFMRDAFGPLAGPDGRVAITDEYRLLIGRR
jgi:hypothetical protein